MLEKSTSNNSITHTKSFSETIFGLPLDVVADEIIDIRYDNFSGHVYDLQTFPSFYTVNGVVVHNCRCVLEAETEPGSNTWIRGLPDFLP